MADLTPEVTNALVRLMKGQIEMRSLPKDELYSIAEALIPGNARERLFEAIAALNDQGETFAQIGDRLRVHAATAARWAKPPAEDRRRRRGESGE